MLVYEQDLFLRFVLSSFILGVALGPFYDLLTLIRALLPEGKRILCLSIFLSDVTFMLTSSFSILTVAFFMNNGKVRLVTCLVTLFTFLLYRVTLGPLTEKVLIVLVRLIKRTVRFCVWMLFRPLRLLHLLISRSVKAVRERAETKRARIKLIACSDKIKKKIIGGEYLFAPNEKDI